MASLQLLQVLTLGATVVAAGGASYAALVTGHVQRGAAAAQRAWEAAQGERLRDWQRAEQDRARGLDQLRHAYEAEVQAVTDVEQLLWSRVNEGFAQEAETVEQFTERVAHLVRCHASRHAVVTLLGSAAVVEQAHLVGRDITVAFGTPGRDTLADLASSRCELVRRMRADLLLETAPIDPPPDLYAALQNGDREGR